MSSLTPIHVRGFYREKLDSGLSPATVHKLHVVLHKALVQAVSDGLIPRNAAEGVKVPQTRRKEIHPLTPEQTHALLTAAHGDRLEALFVLAINTGLRQGELLALKWEDVELERGVLRVRHTLTRTGGKVSVGVPKTKKSRRSVELTPAAAEALRAHLSRQLEEMERVSSLYRPGGLVFANESGGIINPSNLRNRSFARLLKLASLPPDTRFHDLRHTCATLLLSRNVNPKIVSEMLGHSSIAITLDTYSHVLPTMQESAIRALSTNRLFSRGVSLWAEEEPMRSIRIPTLSPEQLNAVEELYRTTRHARLRTRAQMVLLAAERRLVAAQIAEIVRASEETVRRWIKRYLAEGVEGLRDVPHPGAPRKVTEEYRELLVEAVRRRPRSLGLPFSLWTLRRLADYMAEQTGIRVEYETVRVHLKAQGIVLSRPQHTITSPDPEYALKKGDRRNP